MSGKILMPVLLAGMLAAMVAAPGTADATPGNTVTECVPFNPYPGANHQQCTRYHYGDDGSLLFTSVYYIDETGMWYLLP